MRKCVFYLTLLFCIKGYSFSFKQMYTRTNTGFSFDLKELEQSSWEQKLSSMSLAFTGINAKVSYKIPSCKFTENPQWLLPGFYLTLTTKDFFPPDFIITAGTLAPTASYSNLKSPALSSPGTAFGGFASSKKLQTNLSSPDSTIEPSLFLEYNNKFFSINSLFQKDSFCSSLYFNFRLKKFTSMSFSTTGGLFNIKNTTSSWFSETRLFNKKQIWAQNFQASFFSKNIKSKIELNLYQNQFDGLESSFSVQCLLNIIDFSLLAGAFSASSQELFCIGTTNLKTLCQFKLNPQFSFYPKNLCKIKIGSLFLLQDKIQPDSSTRLVLKGVFSSLIQTKTSIYNLNFLISDIPLQQNDTNSIYLSCTISRTQNFRLLKPKETLYFKYTCKNQSLISRLSINLTPPLTIPFYINSTFQANIKESAIQSMNATVSASINLQKKKYNLAAKVEFKFTF